MHTLNLNGLFYKVKMSNGDFGRLSSYITGGYGIQLPFSKKVMVESRLQKRLRELNIASFRDYFNFVFSPGGQQTELTELVNQLTTNKTDFFREPPHFDFLISNVLPDMVKKPGSFKSIKVWSAACASGEEPYTLGIVFSEFAAKNNLFDFRILATDISSEVLQKGVMAVYAEEKLSGIPSDILKKYFLKSKYDKKKEFMVIPELRSKVRFQRLNLMDKYYNLENPFDLIFCRNVLIYFDSDTRQKVINKLCVRLKKGGYLFLGHTDTDLWLNIPLDRVRPSIYIKS